MLLCIRAENARNTWVKARTEQRGDACFFKALSVSPLPRILKLCGILRLVVCRVNIVHLALKASVHYVQILIRQCDIYADVGLEIFHQRHQLAYVICIHLRGDYLGLCLALKLRLELVAL